MKKQNNSKLIKAYENAKFTTELWWNDETKQFDIWRNKKVVKTLTYKGYILFEDMVNVAKIECDEWVNDTDYANMTLNEYLQRNNIKLTELEISSLESVLAQGSFYEESANIDEDGNYYVNRVVPAFIGWEISEEECKGCRGALASLAKKGVINIVEDEVNGVTESAYYTSLTLEFTNNYHELFVKEENRK